MMPMHISGDENVDTSINITSEGGRSLYQLVQFIMKHSPKATTEKVTSLVEEALSLYRGGVYNETLGPQLEEILGNLTGLDNVPNIPFEFQGNRTDLSYFWRKDENGNRPTLSKEIIESIPDENIRHKVEQTMAKCYVDGFLDYNSTTHSYTITTKGIDSIYKSDFVSSRIERETTDILKAEEKLEAESRMTERGFSGCNRITIDVKSLGAVETRGGIFSKIPNTKGQSFIEFKKDEFFYVNEKTIEAYINPNGSYTLLDRNGTPQEIISGEDLSKFYEIKNPAQTKIESATLEEAPSKAPEKKATFKAGDEVWATSQYEEGVSLSQYKVEYAIKDKVNGEIVYKLVPTNLDSPAILQTESCVEKTIFKDQFYGTALLKSESGRVSAIQMKEKLAASALGVPPSNGVPPVTGAIKQATSAAAQTTAKGIGTAAAASTPVTAAVSAAAQVVETTIKGIKR